MKALILVDIQNDFLPGGALAVPEGDEIIPVANQLAQQFDLVVATQDWHPATHGSFASQHAGAKVGDAIDLHGVEQIMWPDHCIQGTHGAAFASSLQIADELRAACVELEHAREQRSNVRVIRKGTDPRIDSYSGFFDNGHRKATGMQTLLEKQNVRHVYIMGLATDYCVKFTALDAIQLGFRVSLVADGCRGVELTNGDIKAAMDTMHAAGVDVVLSRHVVLGR